MRFKVALYPSEEGYAVNVPGLPGCWSQGTTEAEALANITEAIREYLVPQADFDFLVEKFFATDRHSVAKGMVEVVP